MTERTLAERLRAIEAHAGNWDDDTRLLGNLTALEIGETCEQAAAALERLEKLDRERAEWVEAWDMMRDTILDDYGPLEINEILTTIDYHDPRQATPAPAPQQDGA